MDLQKLKDLLEGAGEESVPATVDELPARFYDRFIMHGIHVDLIEPGRVLCSLRVPPRLLEEIEIEAKVLRVGRAVGVVSVELRKKKTGKIIAQGRHTKYLAASSKL